MSSSISQSSISGTATPPAVSSFNLLIPEHERSLAQRMLQYVYDRSAIVTARQLTFWELFRHQAPDVEMSAQDLRSMFFGEVLYEPEHFDDLDYAVNQYINPRFNQIHLEALEFGDLVEEEDYTLNVPRNVAQRNGEMNFDQLVSYISSPFEAARNIQLPPLNLQLVAAPPASSNASQSVDADLKQRFCHLLSEFVYTSDETIEKPALTVQDICERVLALTAKGIRLEDLIEPGMDCYKLLNKIALTGSETETPNKLDQVVPVVPPSSSALKRWKSFDDSGLGNTPPKRRRLNTPSTILARRQHARVRRTFSAPPNNLV